MKERFGNLMIGDKFEWGAKSCIKTGARNAKSLEDLIFNTKDIVDVVNKKKSKIESDSGVIQNGFGYVGDPSQVNEDDQQSVYDFYVGDSSVKDKCN